MKTDAARDIHPHRCTHIDTHKRLDTGTSKIAHMHNQHLHDADTYLCNRKGKWVWQRTLPRSNNDKSFPRPSPPFFFHVEALPNLSSLCCCCFFPFLLLPSDCFCGFLFLAVMTLGFFFHDGRLTADVCFQFCFVCDSFLSVGARIIVDVE